MDAVKGSRLMLARRRTRGLSIVRSFLEVSKPIDWDLTKKAERSLARRAAEMDTDQQRVDAKLEKAVNEFLDRLEATLPRDVYGLVLK